MKTGFLLKFLALPFLVLFGETPRAQFSDDILFWYIMSQLDQGSIKRAMEMENKNHNIVLSNSG